MQADDATIRIQNRSGAWETVGADRLAGIVPENIELTSNEWGSDTAGFDLRRAPDGSFPELKARSGVEVEIGGMVVWSGRLKETPARDGDDRVINVQARGWQYHLDDDTLERTWVHAKMPEWADVRAFVDTNMAVHTAAWQVQVSDRGIMLSLPSGATATNGRQCQVVVDTGPNETATKRIVVTYKSGQKSGIGLYVANGDYPSHNAESNSIDPAPIAAGPTTAGYTFTTPRRYAAIMISNDSGSTMTGDETSWVQITNVQVFRDTAYESGNASILKADTVIKDGLTKAPKLSSDQSQISAGSFSIPHFAAGAEPRTARELWEAANAFHNFLSQIDVYKRPVWKLRPTSAAYEVGTWGGSEFQDTSMNSDEDVYNKVIVMGQGADGVQLNIARTATAPLLASLGETRTFRLQISAAFSTAVANQIGDIWLASHLTTPLKGTLQVQLGGVRHAVSGREVLPAELLVNTGQRIRLSHRIDPDTGAAGRDGGIVSVRYSHNTRSAELQLDNDRRSFDALLARLASVTTASLRQ